MNEELQELYDSTHAMAEMLKLNYDSFVQAGFTRRQAMTLTVEVLKTMYVEDGEDGT